MVLFGKFFLPIFPCQFGENEKLQYLGKTLLGNIDSHNISKKFYISSKTHWDMASGTIPKTRFIAIWPEFFWFLKFVSTWSMGHKIEACDHLSSYITIFTQINLSRQINLFFVLTSNLITITVLHITNMFYLIYPVEISLLVSYIITLMSAVQY